MVLHFSIYFAKSINKEMKFVFDSVNFSFLAYIYICQLAVSCMFDIEKTMFISLFMPLVLLYCRIKLRRSLVLEDRNVADAILPLQDRFIFLLWHSIAVRMTRRLTLDQSLFNGHLFTDMGRIKTVQIFTDIYKFPSLNKVF